MDMVRKALLADHSRRAEINENGRRTKAENP